MASCIAWHQPLSSTVDSTMRAMRTLAFGAAAVPLNANNNAASANDALNMSELLGNEGRVGDSSGIASRGPCGSPERDETQARRRPPDRAVPRMGTGQGACAEAAATSARRRNQ